ncbi:hypothetical protein [Burkholderia ubonensis]|uniref:hypothetical protein n=1 Tax=Burkholderia ubonensis TaxID=101571 RepID=UPI000752C6F0|nr:hypothetical protein [Burkholderia ubonensis]KUZ71671.1 hypothetical protein WI37_25525 [Burkholderia ubonensis]
MEDSIPIAPVAIAHMALIDSRRSAPKLARCVAFYRRPALEQWLMIEADPGARTFCERPGCVMLDGQRYLADFWVRYDDHQELIALSYPMAMPDGKVPAVIANTAAPVTVRRIGLAEPAASRMWVENWQRIFTLSIFPRHNPAPPTSRNPTLMLDETHILHARGGRLSEQF